MGPEQQLTIRVDDDGDQVVLQVRGDLSSSSAQLVVQPALDKHLLDRGRVIVDLSAAVLLWRPAVQLFPTASARVGGWPLARLVLAGADPDTARTLQASRVHLTVPLARDVDQARVLLRFRPPRVARSHELPATATAPVLARSLMASAREDWQLPDDLYEAASAVATELVGNAVEHAATGCELHLALDDHRLHVAVRDRLPDARALPQRGDRDRYGYGLLIVEGLSRNWGVTSHGNGKTVWALLDVAVQVPEHRLP